jgi:Holliday junction resolvasome RuvABC endonuclease subunit
VSDIITKGRKMNIVSIDSAKANIGIFIISEKTKIEISTTISTTTKKTNAEKYLHIKKSIEKLCQENNIEVAFIEDYTYSIKRSQAVTSLAEVKGIILVTLYEFKIPVIKVNPQTWKAMAKLSLPEKKNKEYIKVVNNFYKKEFKTSDECDAYMMLLSMYYIYQGVVKTDGHLILQKKMKAIGNIF